MNRPIALNLALTLALALALAPAGAMAQDAAPEPVPESVPETVPEPAPGTAPQDASPAAPEAPAEPAPAEAVPAEGAPVEGAPAKASAAKAGEQVPSTVQIEQIRRFVSVFRAVQQAYVDPVDEPRLMQSAIRGLLTDLDPHSAYLDAEQLAALSEQASGAYDGLGLEIVQQPDRTLLVVAPIDDTPAAKAGIRPGDVITAIDGNPIEADSADQAVESMRGAPGTPIELTITREGEAAPLQFTLVRETIQIASVRVETLEPGYLYARVSTFQANTGVELGEKLRKLGNRPIRGLVLDLRSNPGGLLNSAVETADLFLDEGVVVSTRGRLATASAIYRAAPGDVLAGAPIVLLTDGGTASAAEVVAGALRDHRRALVMGVESFGKGSVQTVLPLDNGDAIKVTTARYYTPNGISIQAAGIVPDIVLPENVVLRNAGDTPPSVRERDLPGFLRNPETAAEAAHAGGAAELEDFAVREALNLLKGLAVFRKPPAAKEES